MPARTVNLGTMLGLNNRLSISRLGVAQPRGAEQTYLSAADNVDLKADGFLRRRRGFALALSGAAWHSVWGDETEGYAGVSNDLLHLLPVSVGLVPTSVLSDLPELAPISFARMPDGDVVWSNGHRIGRLRGASALPLATPRPAVVPTVSVIAGALPGGRYQMAFTDVGPLGESGSTPPIAITLPDGGGIRIAGLGPSTRVYMTGPNGSAFNATTSDAGDIVTLANDGAALRSLLLADMPPGSIVRHYKGSLLVAAGPALIISEPYYYGLFSPSKGYIPFPAPITVVEPCETGVFVCADRTYWLAGGLLDTAPAVVLPYGGLQGSGGTMRTTDGKGTQQACWLSPRGLVIGAPDGSATNVQEHALKFGAARAGATLFREQDGAHHILCARQEPARPLGAAQGFFAVDNIVKETDL